MKTNFLTLILCVSLTACNSLDIVESKPISDEVKFSRYDSDNKMRYNVYNNNAHLKVVFSTNDKGTQTKILKGGLTIYFDDQGKKKETTFVTFPIESEMPQMNSESEKQRSGPPDMKNFIRQIPNVKVYGYNGISQRLAIHEGDIKTNIYSKGEELFYELTIPFEQFSTLPKSELLEVNIGVISGTINIPQAKGSMPPAGRQGGGPPGGGSINGGGPPRGEGGPPSGGERPDMQSMNRPIDFWFKAVLN